MKIGKIWWTKIGDYKPSGLGGKLIDMVRQAGRQNSCSS